MFPVICEIGPLKIYSYGLTAAVAFLVCCILAERDAKRVGIRSGVVSDLVLWLAVGGIIGARIFYVVTFFSEFFPHNLSDIIMIQKGGLSWQGGLIGALATGRVFVRRCGLPWMMMLDFVAPYAALGQAIGRIGCFLNGCCYGRHWDHGIYFPVHEDTLYPTQLFDAAGLLIIFIILKFQRLLLPLFTKEGAGGSSKGVLHGLIFAQYLMLAPILRFVIEFFRADHDMLYAGLSLYQWICTGLFLAGSILFFRIKNHARH
ncbi:MAG: hypothetical protein COW13_03465 [Candidatus Omnitrophica bacterium CG12_big_fil_rev_8_21_14_0_65_50_5]|nr:MAG: hypothetical protein COW13_03465 [Candidatus Omnitrophica bacterium CG12_big_fil_rev_8_21_14_0_65_50_5]